MAQIPALSLADRGSLVQGLWSAVDRSSGSLKNVPGLVRRVIETEAWREREQDGVAYRHDSFLSFVTTPPLAGCGWQPAKVEALLKDEPEALALWREATTGKPHVHRADTSNRSIKPHHGTTRAYTLERLKRERGDLFAKVCAGELSANAAAIEAGFRKKPVKRCPNCGHEW